MLLSYYLDTVLANFITGALSSLQSAFLLSQELTPAFNLAFNSLETIVNVSTSGIFQHVTFDAVNNSISPALFVLAAAMNQIEANRTSAASLATINDLNVTTIGSLVAQITSRKNTNYYNIRFWQCIVIKKTSNSCSTNRWKYYLVCNSCDGPYLLSLGSCCNGAYGYC